jgi:hypothetical protein
MGSVLFAAPAERTELVIASSCAAGVIMAGAMRRPTSHPRRRWALLAVAWCFAITMLLVIPDIRLLQNLAYGLLSSSSSSTGQCSTRPSSFWVGSSGP